MNEVNRRDNVFIRLCAACSEVVNQIDEALNTNSCKTQNS